MPRRVAGRLASWLGHPPRRAISVTSDDGLEQLVACPIGTAEAHRLLVGLGRRHGIVIGAPTGYPGGHEIRVAPEPLVRSAWCDDDGSLTLTGRLFVSEGFGRDLVAALAVRHAVTRWRSTRTILSGEASVEAMAASIESGERQAFFRLLGTDPPALDAALRSLALSRGLESSSRLAQGLGGSVEIFRGDGCEWIVVSESDGSVFVNAEGNDAPAAGATLLRWAAEARLAQGIEVHARLRD